MNEKSGQRNSTKIVSENLRPYNKYAVAKFINELTDVIYPNFAKSGHQYSQVLLNIIINPLFHQNGKIFQPQNTLKKVF